ncbi:MAG: L-threonylcarbamoyladenylate synthase [Bacteroidota bacterium]
MHKDIIQAIEVLSNGGIILYPTDTIWGIGCDPTNETAIEKIHKIKKSDYSKSMVILINNTNMLDRYVDIVPDIAYDLIEVSTNPLTIVYPGAKNLPENLIAKDGTIGIRVVSSGFCFELISKFRKPVVSTSANYSGDNPPSNFSQIPSEILKSVDYVVAYGQNDHSQKKPSEIIKLGVSGEIEIIRHF